MPSEDRSNYKKIQVWVPLPLWDKLVSLGYSSPTNTVLTSLELLCTKSQETPKNSQENPIDSQENPIIDILNARLVEKDNELQAHQQSRIDDLKDENKKLQDNHTNQVNLLVEQIKELKEDHRNEINRLADQLKEKDSQIKSLTTITESQVNHRPMKMIEASGTKRPWYKFW
jgi:predicted phage tail protein